jgi:hypothetical protein
VENLPAILTNDLVPAEEIWPEWLRIKQLPGMNDPRVRTLGKKTMSRFTKTNHEEIAAIAYILPPNQRFNLEDTEARPHTTQEVKKVIDYIIENGEFLGIPNVESPPLPGYKTSVRQYTLHGIRFQVVMDSLDDQVIGIYVYAWPEKDSLDTSYKDDGDDNETRTIDNQPPPRRIRENDMKKNLMKDTTMKKYNLNEYSEQAFLKRLVFEFALALARYDRELLSEAKSKYQTRRGEVGTNASLTRQIGKAPGGRKLIRLLHKNHRLSDVAVYEEHDMNERVLWQLFKNHPDNFQIVVGKTGVAGIKPFEDDIKRGEANAKSKGRDYDPAYDNKLRYQIVAFKGQDQVDPELLRIPVEPGEEPEERDIDPTVMKARGGIPGRPDPRNTNIFDSLREQIGELTKIIITRGAVEREKISQREKIKKGENFNPNTDYIAELTKKIKPIAVKLLTNLNSEIYQDVIRISDTKLKIKLLQAQDRVNDTLDKIKQDDLRGPSIEFSSIIKSAISKITHQPYNLDKWNRWAYDLLSNQVGRTAMIGELLETIRTTLRTGRG